MIILMIESNMTGVPAVKRAIDNDIDVIFLTTDLSYYKSSPDFSALLNPRCRLIELPSVANVDSCVQLVKELSVTNKIDGVTTFSELHIVHVAAVAAALGLPGMSIAAALNARHKHKTRQVLQTLPSIKQPRFEHVLHLADLEQAIDRVGLPCVVKPSDGTGSLAVVHLSSQQDREAYLMELNECADYGRGISRQADMLVEEFISGALVSVEACVREGKVTNLGITDRLLSGFPHFIEMGCCYLREHEWREELFAMNVAVLTGLGISFGFTHTEYFLTADGPVLCEVNGRLAGGVVPTLMRVPTGVDPLIEVVRLALGHEPHLPIVTDHVAAGRWFGVGTPGVLRGVDFNDVADQEGYIESASYRSAGDKVTALAKSNFDWLGHVIFTAMTPAAAYARAEKALDRTVVSLDLGVAR